MTAHLRPRLPRALLSLVLASIASCAPGVATAAAGARPTGDAPCKLALRDQDTPGGTSAYNVTVAKRRTSCATALGVVKAFHSCRTSSGYRCSRRIAGTWRCTGRKAGTSDRMFAASLTCTSGTRRVRSSYLQDTPECFGAAARDTKHRCVSRARMVVPKLGDPDPELGWECNPGVVENVCVFGVAAKRARRTIAIIGDSHVGHWRAALHHVTQIEGWRGYSLSAGGCFFSDAAALFSEGCGEWSRGAAAVLGRHPEISTLFVTQNADTPVAVQPGETIFDVKARGYASAWKALPTTIRHIVVLRDTTISTDATFACVGDAIRLGTVRLNTACPLARSVAQRDDPAVDAVRRLDSERYQAIDLSRYMCGARACYPVVGGTMVNGDVWGHLNMTFMRTMAPYLLRELRRLEASW